MKRIIVSSILFTLTACSTSQISTQFANESTYVNFNNGTITSDAAYWKRANPPSEKVKVVVMKNMRPPKPISTCATLLLGIGSDTQVKEIVVSHSYGDNQAIRNQVKNFMSSQWAPTAHNSSRQPAVVEIKFTNVPDKTKNEEEFKKECADYI